MSHYYHPQNNKKWQIRYQIYSLQAAVFTDLLVDRRIDRFCLLGGALVMWSGMLFPNSRG